MRAIWIIVTIMVLLCLWGSLASWLLAQRPIAVMQPQMLSQDAVDAVQNEKIMELGSTIEMHSMMLVQLQADRNWLMGGIAMVGGIFVLVQILALVQIRKKA